MNKVQLQEYIRVLLLLIVIFSLCLFQSCSKSQSDIDNINIPFTKEVAMDTFIKLSPDEGAKFYNNKRKDYPFMDSLYNDSILPILKHCNYYELKKTTEQLKDTPYYDTVYKWTKKSRQEYLQSIEHEIEEHNQLQQQTFKSTIIPVIEMDIDSMLEKDVTEIIDNYAGGLFNYKKIFFFFGRNKKDFKKMFWEKFDVDKYTQHIKDHINTYFDTINKKQNKYCKEITGKEFDEPLNINDPEFVVGLSPRTVKQVEKYTSGEKTEMTTEAIKDWIAPAVIGAASGGLSTLYDIGSFAYDIKNTIDDIKLQKLSNDERLSYICQNDVSFQIRKYYLNQWTKRVIKAIDKNNKKLYTQIEEEL